MGIVLQIDDDATSRNVFARVLQRRPSVQVLTADGGRAGLLLAQEHRPDLVVSDLWLPDLTGQEVIVQLRAEPTLADIPVVITSGDACPERIREVMAVGAVEYLTKPYRLERLLEVVDRYTLGDVPTSGSPSDADDGPLAPDALEQLRRLHRGLSPGDPLIADFLADADQLIATVAAGLASGELDQVTRAAHQLAGSAGMFGAMRVSALVSELELLLLDGKPETDLALLGELREEMARAVEALRRAFPLT